MPPHIINCFRLAAAGEALARQLAGQGDYKVLRRLPRQTEILMAVDADNPVTLGIVDLETSGLDPQAGEPIEIAITPMAINADGGLHRLEPTQCWLEQSSLPLDERIVQVTGLTDADLAGRRFDDEAIAALVGRCDVLVSHNARFDRAFMVRRFGALADKPWGCTVSDMDWLSHGLGGRALGHLLYEAGYFYDAHRAGPDSWALACLLAGRAADGRLYAAHLIDAVRAIGCRVHAHRAPFEIKDRLKARGYRWDGEARCWWIDVPQARGEDECAWLTYMHPVIAPTTEKITAWERHA